MAPERSRHTWHCHDCDNAVEDPHWGSSGTSGVHVPYCNDCWANLSPSEQRAVEEERKRPLQY